jgi:hypothetical protein
MKKKFVYSKEKSNHMKEKVEALQGRGWMMTMTKMM